MLVRRALLLLIVLAAPACMRWEGARTPAPAAGAPGRVASGPAAPAAAGRAMEAGDSEGRGTQPGIGQRRALQPARVPAAEGREAGPLTTVAIISVIAAGALAVFLLLAHVNC
jgi:hypothetical protein